MADQSAELMACAKRLSFPEPFEEQFREDYYHKSIGLCRGALAASVFIFMLFGVLDPYTIPSSLHKIWFIRYGLVAPFCLAIVVLSFLPRLHRFMQPAMSAGLLATGGGLLGMVLLSKPTELGFILYPLGLLLVVMVGYSFLRLRFWYATFSNLLLAVTYFVCALWIQNILHLPNGLPVFVSNGFFICGANIVGMASCYFLELYARRVFVVNYLLDEERKGERQQREKTEAMLKILSQAIGGIVHDLGNPLTTIQMGAQTMQSFLEMGEADPATLGELSGMIVGGTQMLDHLRLSLMEQTRVLEGLPIPVNLQPTSLRGVIEAGVQYQKPRFIHGRQVVLSGEEHEVSVDSMKLTSVFMNLIGNALKYSDGKVHVAWKMTDKHLMISIADQGRDGRGLSQAQAERLFVAFGRLENHAEIEGTGLGLLSVRRIVEAHGGEVFVEGRAENVPKSTIFTTAQNSYPSMLHLDFRTAFVVTIPAPTA